MAKVKAEKKMRLVPGCNWSSDFRETPSLCRLILGVVFSSLGIVNRDDDWIRRCFKLLHAFYLGRIRLVSCARSKVPHFSGRTTNAKRRETTRRTKRSHTNPNTMKKICFRMPVMQRLSPRANV
eukprot:scaffold25720_cov156-Amphora_coffeaeformis.AAC.3